MSLLLRRTTALVCRQPLALRWLTPRALLSSSSTTRNALEWPLTLFVNADQTAWRLPTDPPRPSYYSYFYEDARARFDVDTDDLKQRFRRLQFHLHPDRVLSSSILRNISLPSTDGSSDDAASGPSATGDAAAADDEKRRADALAAWSAEVNRAYETLAHPLRRSLYILSEANFPVAELEQASDPTVLLYIIETMEAMSQPGVDEATLNKLREANTERLNESIRETSEAYAAEDYVAIKDATVKMRYYFNMEGTLHHHRDGQSIVTNPID